MNLGQPVIFTHRLKRVTEYRMKNPDAKFTWDQKGYYRHWKSVDVPTQKGIVVGIRTLADGWFNYNGDEQAFLDECEYFQAYLISFHMRRKPWLVRTEHTEALDIEPLL